MATRPVDYLLVGLGNPGREFKTTRHNAGFLFIDYLANVMALDQKWSTPPVFQQRVNLSADVKDVVFTYQKGSVTNSLRILLAKPFTSMNESGVAVKKIMDFYQITDPKKLIVVSDDINTLPGSLAIQDGGDLKSLAGQKGQESIGAILATTNFIRFRLGVGRPLSGSSMTIPQWVLGPFGRENKEMDLFAYLMNHTTQALLDFVQTNDLKLCRKKFTKSKKIPSNLVPTESLEYPVIVEGM
ncbi:peptidyl-tRNA hydrolase, PTH1 family [Entomortierella parvispora]|uniref:Peptidyl-tRNA hydrolase n=1 Tax=Entomortierella parvispora TaxID=205924 RepID=A0A9P3LTV5_9FUNG|nr:peptidyl-tRNA hydrolase, PTH1 family [Entomortierella parvispora]